MELSEFSKGSIWAIMPEKFDLLSQKFMEFKFGIEPKLIQDYQLLLNDDQQIKPFYKTKNGVATIPISGPLTKRQSLFSFLFGGMSYADISNQIKLALADDRVSAIVLNIDSPGGVISGVESVADLVFNSRGKKPIVAFTDGLMASAAYWIGSAADVVIAEKTAMVGSIGVLRIHVDYSESDKKEGIKRTYLTAGKYKALGNDSEPLSDEAKNLFQQELDYIYSIFVDMIARNRERNTDDVLTKMADGKVFIGYQAADAGLIDHVGNYLEAVETAATMINDSKIYSIGGKKMEITSIEQLTAAFPEFVLQIQENAAKKAAEDMRVKTQSEDRENFLKFIEIQFDEQTAAEFKALFDSDITPDQLKAVKNMKPKKDDQPKDDQDDENKKAAMLKAIQDAGADNPGPDSTIIESKDYMVLVREYQAEHKCGIYEAMRAIDAANPELRKNFIRKANAAG